MRDRILERFLFLLFFLSAGLIYSQPSNNSPCNAIALSNSNCIDGSSMPAINYSTEGASTIGVPSDSPICWTSPFSNTVWFTFVATGPAQKVTTNSDIFGTGVNNRNQLAIYSSSDNTCNGLFTLIGCQDDICDCPGSGDNQNAELSVTGLTVGQTYWIAVDGDENSTGLFSIGTQPAPSNDACSNPLALSSGITYSTSNIGASSYSNLNSGDIQFTCGSDENMVFFSFTPPLTGTYFLNQWDQHCTSGLGTQCIIFDPSFNCSSLPQYPFAIASNLFEILCSNTSINARYFNLNLIGGLTYLIGIDGFAGTECSFNINIGPAIILPVEIITLSARVENENAIIRWTTASETNSAFFYVEKSTDALNFMEIGKIQAAGNSSTLKNYSFLDQNIMDGATIYYRIQQVDNNNRFTYSRIIPVETNYSSNEVKILNNPVPDNLNISFNSEAGEKEILTIYSAIGSLVSSVQIPASKGLNQIKLDVSFLPKGIYFVNLFSNTNSRFVRFVKD